MLQPLRIWKDTNLNADVIYMSIPINVRRVERPIYPGVPRLPYDTRNLLEKGLRVDKAKVTATNVFRFYTLYNWCPFLFINGKNKEFCLYEFVIWHS